MVPEPNEFLRLALAIGLAPIVYGLVRSLRFPTARRPFGVMYGAFTGGYALTVLEDFAASDVFNLGHHLCSAVGAIAFAFAAHAVFLEVRRQGGTL
jgi:hypothetical protein